MVLSTSKKPAKRIANAKSTPHTISSSRKKGEIKNVKPRASASLQSIPSSSNTSRRASVEEVEDDEPMNIGGTLDVDGDQIMRLTDDEEDEPNSSGKDPISLEDVWADDEEIQLSMSLSIFSNPPLINYI